MLSAARKHHRSCVTIQVIIHNVGGFEGLSVARAHAEDQESPRRNLRGPAGPCRLDPLRIRVDRDDCVALPQEKFRVLAIIKPDVEHDFRMLAQLCERARGILIVQDAQSSGMLASWLRVVQHLQQRSNTEA